MSKEMLIRFLWVDFRVISTDRYSKTLLSVFTFKSSLNIKSARIVFEISELGLSTFVSGLKMHLDHNWGGGSSKDHEKAFVKD